jgi:non-ribosomal peptide synthetase component F
MAACWEVLLDGMVKDSQQPISWVPMLTTAERAQVLYGFNDTAAAYPQDRLIHELFEEQVQRTPDAIAVVYEQESLRYDQLNARANQLARYLRERGVGPDQRVALCVERCVEMVVGLLGILKAGGAYVPLDPAYPAERLAYMLDDAAPRILLTRRSLRSILPPVTMEVIEIDGNWSAIAEHDDTNLAPAALGLTALHLAYVIYTSGSTGMPKGAMNEHRGMVNRIVAQQDIEAFSESDICCQKTSISFVDAAFEIFGALCNGRPLVIIPAATVSDSAVWLR